MESTAQPPSTPAVARGPLAGLRVRWDRTAIFLAGALLIATALFTGVLAPFTAVTWAVPVVLGVLGAGCVAGLRYLAVEERSARAAQRAEEHAAEARQQPIFDNEDRTRQEEAEQDRLAQEALDFPEAQHEPREQTGAPQIQEPAYTRTELRAEALKVARSAHRDSGSTWSPVPVPKPLYAQAPVVERSEPEPLEVPQAPVSRTATLKDAVAAGEQESAALNLDDVLKRRRA